jgi:hypothetical protein
MKQILPFVLSATILSCGTIKEVQMDMTDVELVKIDTIQRYLNGSEKVLTWQDDNHMSYVTFVPLEMYYAVGTRMKVMVRR